MGFGDERFCREDMVRKLNSSVEWAAHRSSQDTVLVTLTDNKVVVHSNESGVLLEVQTGCTPILIDLRTEVTEHDKSLRV